eukprot:CAMPEP_0172592424 /NCGR_PEP_ID=MMETSP1068-20121228/11392_1 /TAXON_ID=35684 /ORGANISM="Pseudopedinella elastica, Strain CCMP716" /LENGTH=30 /DNA_ID= /DNA_START= /DNA_END= /DNA_ORIENTATION=
MAVCSGIFSASKALNLEQGFAQVSPMPQKP